ncbi:hypothetical protein C8Q78DRAFT_959911 [Trametes maxima]|nr:hypothetical protein C8Q78DRAFT_959911 [Trametes maxima]
MDPSSSFRDNQNLPTAPSLYAFSSDETYKFVGSHSTQDHAELAPNQPLTTLHGKPRERVFVACVRCRTRKIRCDGTKPECNNCSRRTRLSESEPCVYDVNPRRRGKDRTPGSRKLAPLIPKKTRTTRSRYEGEAKRDKSLQKQTGPSKSSCDVSSSDRTHESLPFSTGKQDERGRSQHASQDLHLDATPGVQFIRETWWDALIAFYAATTDRSGTILPSATDIRHSVPERIYSDLRLLFRVSLLWFGFFNVPRFFSSLINSVERRSIQPCLILATLALSTLYRSSKLELGEKGMEKALKLVEQAYSAFHASLNSGRVDVGLAQTAYVLAAFELQAHPKASLQRMRDAMSTLDAIIRYLALTTLDVDDVRTTIFLPHAVPSVTTDVPVLSLPDPVPNPLDTAVSPFNDEAPPSSPSLPFTSPEGLETDQPCGCDGHSLGNQWPQARDLAPQFAQMPMWSPNADTGELHKEECRRLVWASVILATGLYNTRLAASAKWEPHHLWIKDPSNYALLFPGESLASSVLGMPFETLATSKDSVWALYIRALLLWNGSQRAQGDVLYARDAWAETDRIEAALDRHSCVIETGFCVKMREVLFNTRMCISHELQEYTPGLSSPLLRRDKAEQWMVHQMLVAKYFAHCLRHPKTSIANHARRNFLVAWLMSQIARALALWEADSTLSIALDVARTFAPSTEYYMRLWTLPEQQRAYDRLYERLVFVCMAAGVSPPPRTIPLGSAIRGVV